MTTPLSGPELARRLREHFADAIEEEREHSLTVRGDKLLEVARFLKETPDLSFDYLTSITGVDYIDYLEVVYHLASITHNHSFILRVRAQDTENPEVTSLTTLWQGANLQEREVYDLMGIRFSGHPDLRRIFLWEGFHGHPLRKSFLTFPR